MAHCLVTGGAGFIGGHLAEALVRAGHQVRVLDDFSTGSETNLESVRDRIELVRGDIRDLELCRSAIQGIEVVFHQAALPSVPRSVREPVRTNEVNATGTLNVLTVSRDLGVRRLVFASSSSVYGDTPTLPKVETMPTGPLSPYALQKATAEAYTKLFHRLYGLETIALRYFNVFGPRQDPASEYAAVIPRFITRALRGEPILIHGDGEQSRDFTYVENAVAANLAAMRAPGTACGKAFNVACGAAFSLNTLVKELSAVLGRPIAAEREPSRVGDVKHSLADVSAARQELGYVPGTTFQDGLRATVQYFQSKK